jgi:hypothetical protein
MDGTEASDLGQGTYFVVKAAALEWIAAININSMKFIMIEAVVGQSFESCLLYLQCHKQHEKEFIANAAINRGTGFCVHLSLFGAFCGMIFERSNVVFNKLWIKRPILDILVIVVLTLELGIKVCDLWNYELI